MKKSEAPIFPQETIGKWLDEIDVLDETRRAYCGGMRAFERFLREKGVDPHDLGESDVIEFKRSLETRLAPDSVSSYLIGVRSFYRWIDSPVTPDIAAHVKGVRRVRGFKKDILTPAQASRLLDETRGSSLVEARNHAILNLMLRTGVRSIEVVRANKGDIRTKAGCPVLYVHGKGRRDKDEFVVLTEEALGPIDRYLAMRPSSSDDDPLFASTSNRNKGGRLTTRTVSGIAKNAMRAIGIDDMRHTAHSRRHTAVTYALLGGAALEEAQTMARHADISTTMVYSHHIDRIGNAAERKIGQVLDARR